MKIDAPSALAEISKGRDHLNTAEFARLIGKSSQTIRKLNCLNGQAFGIRPVKIGAAGAIQWPCADVTDSDANCFTVQAGFKYVALCT